MFSYQTFLDEKGGPITMLQGELSAKELEPYLSLIYKIKIYTIIAFYYKLQSNVFNQISNM